MVTKLGPLCEVKLLKNNGDLKRLASAVQLRPWPAHSKHLQGHQTAVTFQNVPIFCGWTCGRWPTPPAWATPSRAKSEAVVRGDFCLYYTCDLVPELLGL